MAKKISLVIPSVNEFRMLFQDCINSFDKFDKAHEIIVVDDGSQPMLQKQVEDECKIRGVKFEKNPKNSGFSVTVNRGIKAATGDIIVLVNNDVVFTNPVIEQIEKTFEIHPKIGIAGALLFYPNGTVQHGGILPVGHGGFTHRGWHKTLEESPEIQKQGYLIGVTGALFAIKRECLDEIGLFNEKYFLSCDDTEFCLRAWTNNWRVFYNPDIKAIHAEGFTRGRTNAEKQSKHRTWFLKEMETWGKFQEDVKTIDIGKCLTKVNECNAELQGITVSGNGCFSQNFETGLLKPYSVVKQNKEENIYVRRTGALGDVVLTTGIIRRLRKENPKASITVSTHCAEVFANNPHVTRVIKDEGMVVDRTIDLDMAYEKDPNIPIWEAYSKVAFGDVDFDVTPEMFSTATDKFTLERKLPMLSEKEKIAVLHMSISWINRTWPRHNWMNVVNLLLDKGFRVVTIGKGGDYLADVNPGVVNAVNALYLSETRELMKKASVFVGMDSGMLHVAQTTNVPIVGLFTVANPKNRIIQREFGKTVALVPQTECRFCLHEQTPPVTFVGCKFSTNHCLTEIRPVDVLNGIEEAMK